MADQNIIFTVTLENGQFKLNANQTTDSLNKMGDAAKSAGTSSDGASNAFGKMNTSMIKQIATAGLAYLSFRKIFSVFGDIVKATSDLTETQNKYNVTFKEVKPAADAAAKSLQDMYGMSQQESKKYLSDVGDLLSGLGMTQQKSLELSIAVTKLGTDLASFTNIEGGHDRAIKALTTGLTGEREAMKALGIVINEEMITAELRKQHKEKLTGLALQQAKAEATLALATEQSKNAVGDMARSYDSFANVQRRVHSRVEDLEASLGGRLTPALGNLGLAFLDATNKGGVLYKFLKGTIDLIADAISGWALLIATMNQKSLAKQNEANLAYSKEQMKIYKESVVTINQQWGSYEKLVAKSKENTEEGRKAAQYLLVFNAHKQKALAATQLAQKGFEQEGDALKSIIKIQERIKNKETEIGQESVKKSAASTQAAAKELSKQYKMLADQETAVSKYYEDIGKMGDAAVAKNRAQRDQELSNLAKSLEDGAIKKAQFNEYKLALEADYAKKEQDIRKLAEEQKVITDATAWQQKQQNELAYRRASLGFESKAYQGTQMIANAGMQLMGEKNKVLFNIGKASAIAAITMNAAEAILKGMSYGPFIGIPYAALVGTVSALQLARVAVQKPPEAPKIKNSGVPSLPSFAVGTWNVPYDMTANIHKDEMIIPKTFADSVRSGEASVNGGGGMTIIVQGSIIDSQGLLDVVDNAQQGKAGLMGAYTYKTRSAY